MADPVYPLVNGNRYSWASIEIAILNFRFRGFKSIDYANLLEPGKVRGTGPQKLGRTRGDLDSECSFEIYKKEYYQLIRALSVNGAGYLETEFGIVVSYSERGETEIITDEIIGCRIKKPAHSGSQGTDPLVVKCDLDVMIITEDGLKPVFDMLGV